MVALDLALRRTSHDAAAALAARAVAGRRIRTRLFEYPIWFWHIADPDQVPPAFVPAVHRFELSPVDRKAGAEARRQDPKPDRPALGTGRRRNRAAGRVSGPLRPRSGVPARRRAGPGGPDQLLRPALRGAALTRGSWARVGTSSASARWSWGAASSPVPPLLRTRLCAWRLVRAALATRRPVAVRRRLGRGGDGDSRSSAGHRAGRAAADSRPVARRELRSDRALRDRLLRARSGSAGRPDQRDTRRRWRIPILPIRRDAAPDHPHTAEAVHATVRSSTNLALLVHHEEDDFVLDVLGRDPRSVAQRMGLV